MTSTSPATVNRTLPKRLPNSAYRAREYLTEKEVDRLIDAARKRGRNGARDAAAILLAYRHGLRASELCALRWAQIDLKNGRLHVNRAKGGIESVHPSRRTDGNNDPLPNPHPAAASSSYRANRIASEQTAPPANAELAADPPYIRPLLSLKPAATNSIKSP